MLASKTPLVDFANSALSACFIFDEEIGEYQVKMHAELPSRPAYFIGSIGDARGEAESFRLMLPTPLAVGDRGTILNLSNTAIKLPYPTFATQHINVDGYHVIAQYFGAPTFRVGRLMALAWLPRPEGATEVDHIDGDPAHDELDNLEWVTHSENLRRGRHSARQQWEDSDYVLMIREGDIPKIVHPRDAASVTGSRNQSHIFRRGTRRSTNGWYMAVNPSRTDALNFVGNLPFKDTSPYAAAVKELFEELGID